MLDLTDKQAKAYRLIDNKTAEYAKWTPNDLAAELRELGEDLPNLQSFFLEDLGTLLADSVGDGLAATTAADVRKAETRLGSRFGYGSETHQASEKEITCPHCGGDFYISGS